LKVTWNYKKMENAQLNHNKPVVVMRIMGGLASQMHKYGIGRSLADKNGCDLLLDLTWFEKQNVKDTRREFLLNKLKARFSIASNRTIAQLRTGRIRRKLSSVARKFGLRDNLIKSSHYIRSNNSKNLFDVLPSVYIEGEWFGSLMIKENRDSLLNDFSLRDEITGSASVVLGSILESESVAIHVRRGDFVKNREAASFNWLTNIEYYKVAADYLREKVANPKFFVFSDDIEWATENLSVFLSNPYFVDGNMPYEDIYLMKNCKHQIIANSGFGWFGAWLNTNKRKILIAPKAWVKDAVLNNEICDDLEKDNFRLL